MEAKNVRLRHFNEDERQYVLLCLADEKSLTQIVNDFQSMFLDFGRGVDRAALKPKLYERVRNIKRNHSDEISSMAEIIHVDITGILNAESKDSSALGAKYIFGLLYRLWIETPTKEFQGFCIDSRGKKREVYKFLTRQRLQILIEIEKLARKTPKTDLPIQIPLTDPMCRVKALEQLLCETPMKSFLRYSRKDAKDIYEYHFKDILKILQQAEIEMEYLPEEFKQGVFP